ncbi:MAG: VWA domain-containing protein [Firmicutes bacterium]|nr:VWA domain-containing protein [Bacillota bacterium]
MGCNDTGNHVDSVQAQVMLSHSVLPVGRPGKLWAVIKLSSGSKQQGAAERLPLNVGVVLDRSGSMGGRPLDYVKQAAKFLVEQVGANDFLSLTVFDSQVDVVFPAQRVTNKDVLKQAVESIVPGGSTNLSGGLLRGYEETLKERRSDQVNRVLLLTDGMANAGIVDPDMLEGKVSAMMRKGVSLSTVGVGLDFNEDLLIRLAEAGNGSYYYVREPDEIPSVFASELQGLLSVVAQNIGLKVHGLSGCRAAAVLGYEPAFDSTGMSLSLPDMFHDEQKMLAVEMDHPALAAGEHEVLKIRLSYADAAHDLSAVSLEVTAKMSAGAAGDQPEGPDFEVIKIVELAKTAVVKDQSVEAIDRGDFESGRRALEERLTALKELQKAYGQEDPDLQEEISNLERMSVQDVDAFSTCFDAESRKDLRYQSYQTRRNRPTNRPEK